jgi:tRNA dimethylallyltransferase
MMKDVPVPEDDELLVVVGPTASGKTALAIQLAEQFGGEIVGADSVQIYTLFDIGSGKPNKQEREQIPYHMIDVADPLQPWDAATFAEQADRVVVDIRARNRVPIVCGGTFLWVKALLMGLTGGAPRSEELREQHQQLADKEGRLELHRQLAEVDPQAAEKLHPNDLVRVSRALEVFQLTGKRLSELHASHGFAQARYKYRLLGIAREKESLELRIAERTHQWLEHGWIDEVRLLFEKGYGETRAMASVGYQQVASYVQGDLKREELADSINRATKIFVRRQKTWLREEPVTWITAS